MKTLQQIVSSKEFIQRGRQGRGAILLRKLLSTLAATATDDDSVFAVLDKDAPLPSRMEPMLAPLSVASDVANNSTLRTTSAMKLATHHLFTNKKLFSRANKSRVNLFCVSQACVTFPVRELHEKLEQARETIQTTTTSSSLSIVPVVSEMWIQSLGTTSITFGHSLSLHDQMLAKITRIFVRQNVNTGKLLTVSDQERSGLFPPLLEPNNNNGLPVVLRPNEPPLFEHMEHVFEARVGPQHVNEHRLVDPSALADIALQGLALRGYQHETHNVSCHYLVPAQLNQTLSVRIHSHLPLVGLYNHQERPSGTGQQLMCLVLVTPKQDGNEL